jgi:hypothetical protein
MKSQRPTIAAPFCALPIEAKTNRQTNNERNKPGIFPRIAKVSRDIDLYLSVIGRGFLSGAPFLTANTAARFRRAFCGAVLPRNFAAQICRTILPHNFVR